MNNAFAALFGCSGVSAPRLWPVATHAHAPTVKRLLILVGLVSVWVVPCCSVLPLIVSGRSYNIAR